MTECRAIADRGLDCIHAGSELPVGEVPRIACRAGLTYSFVDLTPTDAPPELAMTLCLKSDLPALEAKLNAKPPECVLFGESEFDAYGQPAATAEDRFGLPTFLVGLLDHPTITPVPGGTVWCGR